MKKLALLLLALNGLAAQTVVQQTLINPSGRPQSGQVTITNPSFTTASGTAVSAGTTTYPITNGLLSIHLYPTVGAVPTGTLYSVSILVGSGGTAQVSYELWNVPVSANPVSRASVVVASADPSAQTISLAQLTNSGATDQQVATWSNLLQKWIPQDQSGSGGSSGIFGPSTTVTGFIPLWANTIGTLQGSGVAAPIGTIVGTSDTQTLTNKSISGSQINSGTVPSAQLPVGSPTVLGAVQCDNTTITCAAGLLVAVGGGGGMVYPGAGIPISIGSAWGSSVTAPTGAIVGTSDTQTLTNKSLTKSEITDLPTFPTGTIIGASDTQTLTNKSIAGSEVNSGTIPAAQLPVGSSSAFGAMKCDNSTITCTSGVLVAVTGGSGNASLSATNQVWTGAGSLTLTNGTLIFPIGVNSPIASVVTHTGTVGGHAVGGGLFQLNVDPQPYTGSDTPQMYDDQMSLGYNRCMGGSSCISTEPGWWMGWEHNYCVPGNPCATNLFNEWYMQFQPTPNTATGAPSSGGASRPIFVQVHRDPTCVLAGTCIINDFELNSDPTIGIGFHDWSNNGNLWAKLSGNTFKTYGISGQSGPSLLQCTGLNTQGCEFNFTDQSNNGYRGIPISSTQWEFDLLGTSNWIAYNANRTSLGGSSTFNGNATFSVQAPTGGTNVVMSLGLNTSNTSDFLRFYGNTGTQLGQVSSIGLLTLPAVSLTQPVGGTSNILNFYLPGGGSLLGQVDYTGKLTLPNIVDSALTSGHCVQAGTAGLLGVSSAACLVYPGAGISVSTGSAWGTSLTAPTGTIVGTSDIQTLTNKSIAGSQINSGTVPSAQLPVGSPTVLGAVQCDNTTITCAAGLLVAVGGGGGMVYPGAGIPISTGSAWGSSVTAPTGTIVGTTDTQTLTNKSIAGSEVNSGTVPAAQLPVGSSSAFGAMKCDNVTITCTSGILTDVNAGNTTSTSLVSGNLPVANGSASLINSGVGAASGVITAIDIKSTTTSPLLIDSTSSTGGVQFRNSSSTVVGFMNNSGHLTAGAATDLAGTGSAIYAAGDIQVSGGQVVKWVSRATLGSPADGQLQMTNNSQNGFNYLCWSLCGTGTGFRLNNASGVAQFQNAAGSADAVIEALSVNIVQASQNKTGSSGSCNFIQPFQGSFYKKVIAICSGLNGTTATYTFPVAFVNSPGYYISGDSLLISTTVTSATMTVTSSAPGGLGTITLEGY